MLIPTDLNQLIHAIYQGALEPQPWTSCLQKLNQLFAADMATLLVVPGKEQSDKYLFNQQLSPSITLAETSHHWIALDPFQDIAAATPIRLDDLFDQRSARPNSHTAIEETSFFQDLIQPAGIRYILAINIAADSAPGLLLKLRIGRTADKADFSDSELKLLASLVEHFKLALQFFDHMAIQQIERNAFADAINQFMLGTLILDRSGVIVASNRVARDTIDQHDELKLVDGSLILADKNTNRELYNALADIDRSVSNPVPRTIIVTLKNTAALGLMIRPVRPEDAHAHPVHAHAVVFISDSQGTRKISSETLKDLFGLTGSEAKVAAYLANGHTLTEAAEALSISINTAKSHARNIYEKTGVNKQTKFIQLVSNSVARVS